MRAVGASGAKPVVLRGLPGHSTPVKRDPHAEREARKYENLVASREHIRATLEDLGGPASLRRLAGALGMRRDQEDGLEARLRAMVRDGELLRHGRGEYAVADQVALIEGPVQAHADGFGFVQNGDEDDVYLSRSQMRGVFHGDVVRARVTGADRRGRPSGRIESVLERRTARLVGVIERERGQYVLHPSNRRQHQLVEVNPDALGGAQPGQIISVVVTRQPDWERGAQGEVEAVLGDHLTPGIEVEIAVRDNDLPVEFGEDALAEADALPARVPARAKAGRADLRDLPLVTIDGEDARDFDDGVYCEPHKEGFRLVVAIADVAHYVKDGSPLDIAARERGTSVYFPQYVIPMLPESLSNGLCSLKEGVDRLAMVCDMVIGKRGAIRHYTFYEATIRSHRRFTYFRVQEILEGANDALEAPIRQLHDLYRVLLASRNRRGAVDFDSPELRILFDEEGEVTGFEPIHRKDAHRLIEECMLCANVCAARLVRQFEADALYRVHEQPELEKIEYLRTFLSAFGLKLGGDPLPTPHDYQAAAAALSGRRNGRFLQLALLRSMQQAVYQPENKGHFGLNYEAYAHFTSPIRRYPDLTIHRYVKAAIHGAAETAHVQRFEAPRTQEKLLLADYPYPPEAVVALGVHTSMAERRADTAAWDVITGLKCRYLAQHVGDDEDGVITAVAGFGLFVELSRYFCEGMIHVSSLGGEYFTFDPASQTLVGDRSGRHYGVGDSVRVQIVRVDPPERKVDLELLTHQPLSRRAQSRRSKSDRRSGRKGDRKGGRQGRRGQGDRSRSPRNRR
ncbi:MAG: ribonuclease R [Gammaproteobacteria bacterium]|nr:ribonuclease R [Gammaproteobacteria bacterium]